MLLPHSTRQPVSCYRLGHLMYSAYIPGRPLFSLFHFIPHVLFIFPSFSLELLSLLFSWLSSLTTWMLRINMTFFSSCLFLSLFFLLSPLYCLYPTILFVCIFASGLVTYVYMFHEDQCLCLYCHCHHYEIDTRVIDHLCNASRSLKPIVELESETVT